MKSSRILPGLTLSLAMLAAAVPLAATELAGLRFVPDPALPVAGQPLRIALDFSATGDPGWCRWQRDTVSGPPPVTVDHHVLVLHVYRVDPVPPCFEVAPQTLDFEVPAALATEGYQTVEVRRTTGFLQEETLGRFGIQPQPVQSQLRLQSARFLLEIDYRDPRDGQVHTAHALRSSEESGTFWFFDPKNPEILVKLLDGSGINGHFWLYASSLTTLEYTLRILDTAGGCLNLPVVPPACPTREYHQPEGAGHNLEDVEAMPAVDRGPEPPILPLYTVTLRPDPAFPRRGQPLRILSDFGNGPGWCRVAQLGTRVVDGYLYLLVEDRTLPILPPPCPTPPGDLAPFAWTIDTSSPELAGKDFWEVKLVYERAHLDPGYAFAATGFDLGSGRATSPYTAADLLLHQGAFLARVDWRDPVTGESLHAAATQLSTDSGQFTFFDPGNVEVTVKLLDGRAVNGHWWLFVASETRLPYTLTVVRDAWGCGSFPTPPPGCEVYTFTHPEGPAQNRVDIEAFAGEEL